MLTKFKLILLLGFVFGLLVGCTVEDNSENILPEFTTSPTMVPTQTRTHRPSMTVPPTGVPDTRPTWTPKPFIPSATSQPTAIIFTPTAAPEMEEIFVREGVTVPQPEELISVENANQLVELARWGYGAINQVSHTRNGRLMLVQTDVGVYAYQVGTLNEVWRFIPGERVDTLGLDESGRVMVQVEGEMIYLLNSENGRVIDSFLGEIQEQALSEPSHGLYHEDGKIIRSSDQSILLKFWELNLPGWLYFAGISSSGNYVVFIGEDSGLAVYRISSGERVLLFDPENIMSMAIPHLAKPAQLGGPTRNHIGTFVFSRSENFLIAANGYGQIFFFDLQQGELHISVHGNGRQLMIPPYSDTVIFYDEDTVELYGIPSGQREAELNYGCSWEEMQFSPGGTRIAQGATLWNIEDGTFQTMPENEKVVGFNENGNYVYSVREGWWWVKRRTTDLGLHSQVHLDMTLGLERLDHSFQWLTPHFWISPPDGKLLQGGWYDTPYLMWSTDTGELVSADILPFSHVASFSPNGEYLVEVEDDSSTLIKYRQPDGTYSQAIRIETWGVDIDFIGNEYLIMTNQVVRVYSLLTLELIRELRLDDLVWTTAVSPDGTLLAASLGYAVVLVDIETGEARGTLNASSWGVDSLAFSPDGRYLATAADNGVIRLWGVPHSQGE